MESLVTDGDKPYIDGAMRLSEQVRERLRDEMQQRKISQREIGDQMRWSQGRISKLLNGSRSMDLDDLEGFCTVLGIRPTEAVRDRGFEFAAELTPTELRLLETLRKRPRATLDAVMTLLHVAPATASDERPKKPAIGPGRR